MSHLSAPEGLHSAAEPAVPCGWSLRQRYGKAIEVVTRRRRQSREATGQESHDSRTGSPFHTAGMSETPLRHESPKRQLAGRRAKGSGSSRCVAEGTASAWLKVGPARGRRVADQSATAWPSRRRGPRRRMAGAFSVATALTGGGVPQLLEQRPRSPPRWQGWLLQGALMCHQKALVRHELQSSRTPVQHSHLHSPLHPKEL